MRRFLIALLLTATPIVAIAPHALAQTTTETDKSEEDWRKSQKKRDSSDIFKDFKNILSQGGNGIIVGPDNPMDNLPDESRRHLSKERAKAIAISAPGEPIDAPYNPSDAAKTDPELAEMEEAAWKQLVDDLNGVESTPAQDTPASGGADTNPSNPPLPAGGQSQSGQPSSASGQSSTPSQQSGGSSGDSQDTPPSQQPSVMRGGSSSSVADILAQIKGQQSGAPSGQSGQQPQDGQTQTAGSEAQNGQSEDGQDSNAQASESGDGDAKANGESPQSVGEAAAQDAAAKARAQAETISPLERIKRDKTNTTSGSQTSASDYLKKKDK